MKPHGGLSRSRLSRRALLALGGVALVPSGIDAQESSTDSTPPEDCLEIETFPVPGGDAPHDVAPAADGRVWYTARGAGALGLLDPATGEIERVELGAGSAPHGVDTDGDGIAWVTDGGLNAMVRVDPATMAPEVFPVDRENANMNREQHAYGA